MAGGNRLQISSRFTIAVHMLAYISMYGEKEKVTSEILSGSIQVNPVIIRRLLSRMKTAGLITVARGAAELCLRKRKAKSHSLIFAVQWMRFMQMDFSIFMNTLIPDAL